MVLYTEKAKFSLGSEDGTVRTSSQMETDIITAYEGANNALVDSGVNMKLRIVHVQQVKPARYHYYGYLTSNETLNAVC